jgi:hypothetical protein
MGYLNCELFHFNPNAISALSTFVMLCECWLGIAPDTSLFWYYYSLAQYSKVVYDGIGLSLCCHRRDEYILASFKSCWKGSQERWILVDVHKPVLWENRLMFPPIIKDKWNESPMNDRLTTLVKHVAELREAGLKACHSVEEKLAFECVTPTFCKNKTFCANRSTYKIIVLVKNFPKINLA